MLLWSHVFEQPYVLKSGIWQSAVAQGSQNVLIQVKEVRFGAGRIRSHSHMPCTDQWLAFSSHDGSD